MTTLPDLVPPWSSIPLVNDDTRLFPEPTMTAVAAAVTEAVVSSPELSATIGEVATSTAVEAEKAVSYYWTPEPQPAARVDEPGYYTDAYGKTAPQYITDHFEPLRAAHPTYITRQSLGKDASGTFDVWRYQFTPKNYTKTLVLFNGVHGGEIMGMLAMIRFFHYLANEWETAPQLAYIRENVRIVYVPFVNPWGTSQMPGRARYNANGVDLNRNFPTRWAEYVGGAPFSHDYKGTAPASEVETQYYMQTVADFPDAISVLDFHNTGSTVPDDFYVEMPPGYPHLTYHQLVGYFTEKWDVADPVVNLSYTTNPNGPSWVWADSGIPASNAEWCNTKITGAKGYSAAEITHALAWYANIIIEHCRAFEANVAIEDVTLTNVMKNSALTDMTGWPAYFPVQTAAGGVVSGTPSGSNASPYLRGELKSSVYAVGDVIRAQVEAKSDKPCTLVRLVLRDTVSNITGVIAQQANPPAGQFVKLAGDYTFTAASASAQLQIWWTFATAAETSSVVLSVTKPLVLNLKADLGRTPTQPERETITDQFDWFQDTATVQLVHNADALPTNQQGIVTYFLNRLRQIESNLA